MAPGGTNGDARFDHTLTTAFAALPLTVDATAVPFADEPSTVTVYLHDTADVRAVARAYAERLGELGFEVSVDGPILHASNGDRSYRVVVGLDEFDGDHAVRVYVGL